MENAASSNSRLALSQNSRSLSHPAVLSSSRGDDNDFGDPLGLSVLYAPEEPRSADLIFVHGLGGTSIGTWSDNRDPSHCWPKYWLPTEPVLRTARVLSFGYDAHFLSATKCVSGISDFAKSLLFDMKFRKDDQMRDLEIGNVSLYDGRAS